MHPAYSIIHEGGHLYRAFDLEWKQRVQEAKKLLDLQLMSQAIDGWIWLPDDPVEKVQHLEAWKLLGEEERRASAIAIYTIGGLRMTGLDPMPQHSNEAVAKIVNKGLKSHDKFRQGFSYTPDEIGYFLSGNLPIPILGERVASYLDESLSRLQ